MSWACVLTYQSGTQEQLSQPGSVLLKRVKHKENALWPCHSAHTRQLLLLLLFPLCDMCDIPNLMGEERRKRLLFPAEGSRGSSYRCFNSVSGRQRSVSDQGRLCVGSHPNWCWHRLFQSWIATLCTNVQIWSASLLMRLFAVPPQHYRQYQGCDMPRTVSPNPNLTNTLPYHIRDCPSSPPVWQCSGRCPCSNHIISWNESTSPEKSQRDYNQKDDSKKY